MESSSSNMSGSMVGTWIVVLWVILTLWLCAILIAFRKHIRIVLKRLAKFLGMVALYKHIKRCLRYFGCRT